jgi:hypothetical protein
MGELANGLGLYRYRYLVERHGIHRGDGARSRSGHARSGSARRGRVSAR